MVLNCHLPLNCCGIDGIRLKYTRYYFIRDFPGGVLLAIGVTLLVVPRNVHPPGPAETRSVGLFEINMSVYVRSV